MIHGDIDLTTNLDFYRDKEDKKKKSIHQYNKMLPWSKKKSREKDIIDPSLYNVFSNGYLNFNTVTSYYDVGASYSNNQSRSVRVYQSGNNTISTISPVSYYTYESIDNNSTRYIYNINTINWYTNMTTSSSSLDNYNTISFSTRDYEVDHTNDGILLKFNSPDELAFEEKPSIFGPRKKHKVESIFNYHYCCNKYSIGDCRCKKKVKGINDSYKFERLFNGKDNKIQSHQNELYDYYTDAYILIGNDKREYKKYVEKSERRIPWLRNLPSRIYNDYITDLFEQQDYSKYLTDMSWLRIRR